MLRAIVDTWIAALRTLGAHKLRSALTLLGIVIGVVAVVAMSATTTGLRDKMMSDLEGLGAGVFQIQKWPMFGNGGTDWAKFERRKNITIGEVALLQQACQNCERVGGEVWEMGQRVTGTSDKASRQGTPIAGGTTEFFDNNGYAIGSGRSFNEAEAAHTGYVAVVGSDVADTLYPGQSALGETIRIADRPFKIIGVLERRGETMQFSIDNIVCIPISTWFMIYGSRRSLNITVMARDPAHRGIAEDEVVALLRQERGVPPEEENDFEMFSNASMQQAFDEMTGSIVTMSIGITAIALLIGGIGVMNIMLVAVTERTSEIGLRRALGARRRRILGQFVTEAVVLTSVGGLLGVLFGAGVAYLIRVLADVPTSIPATAVVYAMLTAGITGLVFGIYPAWRASQLDPVEAMRQE